MTAHLEERGPAAKGGVVAGLVGGMAMATVMMVSMAMKGMGAWAGAKMPAMPFVGDAAMRPGFDGIVLLGMMVHFAVSIAWAIPFALLAYGLRKPQTVALGVAWGLVSWIVMFYVVLPIAGASQMARGMSVGMAIFEHALFGLFVGLGFLPFQHEHVIPRRSVA